MKAGWGHWAIVLLIVFIVVLLGIARIKNYDLAALDSELFANQPSIGCIERFSGTITLKHPVAAAKLLVTLDYSLSDVDEQKSVLPTDGRYSLSVRGQPKSNQTWTLRAYYFDQTGQLAETAQQFNNLTCDQQIGANLEL